MYDKNGNAVMGATKIALVKASGSELSRLEELYGVQQCAVVDDLIEDTCWSDHPLLAPFKGRVGTQGDRLTAVLSAMQQDGC